MAELVSHRHLLVLIIKANCMSFYLLAVAVMACSDGRRLCYKQDALVPVCTYCNLCLGNLAANLSLT